jgi:copper chaperone CopZ
METIEMTIEQCVNHIVNVLEQTKIKKKDIDVQEDTIYFSYGGTNYQIFLEGPEDIHYGITDMEGVDLESDFWANKDEYGDYLYIEEYLDGVVFDKRYDYVKKIWNALEKVDRMDNQDDLLSIVAFYFGLTE